MNELDREICLRAVAVRDARFDGVFFLGVTSTGIYCRTVCRARRPKAENCRFFPNAAAAERAGFRPCRLCGPEGAPGFAPVDAGAALAVAAVREIEAGVLGDGEGIERLAERLGITSRHLRRVVRAHLGVSPVELAQTRRLLLAKSLLEQTTLPVGEVALASGFRSLRRCNALFLSRYGMPPTAFRKSLVQRAPLRSVRATSRTKGVPLQSETPSGSARAASASERGASSSARAPLRSERATPRSKGVALQSETPSGSTWAASASERGASGSARAASSLEGGQSRLAGVGSDALTLVLHYRPPFAWAELMRYFMGRAIPGVERVTLEEYVRTFSAGGCVGWVLVRQVAGKNGVGICVSRSLAPVLPMVLAAVRRAFDLDAVPEAVAEVLGEDELLAESVREAPGLRLPGAMDPFETAVRTIIGQQVSVAAATTVMGRVVRTFGARVETPWPDLNCLTLTAEAVAGASVEVLAPLGLNRARAMALLNLARAVVDGRVSLGPSADPVGAMARLQELPGIGPWTAHYFGMRILGWPDAFIAGDLVVKKALAPLTLREIEARSRAWSPWRAYAVMHLWRSVGFFKSPAGAAAGADPATATASDPAELSVADGERSKFTTP